MTGLAASALMAALPIVDLGRHRNLALAQTNPQVTSPSLKTGQTLYKNLYLTTYKGNERTKQLASDIVLQSLYRSDNPPTPEKAAAIVRTFQMTYDQEITRGENLTYQRSKSETDNYLFAIEVVGKAMKAGGSGGDAGGEILQLLYKNFVFDPIKEQWTAVNQYTAFQEQYNSHQAVHDFEGEILNRMVTSENPQYKQAHDMIHAADLNTSINETNDGEKIIASHPELQVPALLQDLIKKNQDLNISVDQLRELMGKEFDKLQVMYADQMKYLKTLDAQQKQLLAYAVAEEDRRKNEAEAQRKAQEYQLVLDGANSTIYLLSQLIGIADKQAGNDFAVIGKSAIQVGDAITKFVESVAAFGKNHLTGLALGMSGAIMTGNIVGAVMNVISLFLPQGPTLEEQVAQLHQEMNERFDRVEARLNEIYDAIQLGFDRAHQDAQTVLKKLSQVERQLTNIGNNIQESLKTGERRDLIRAIDKGITSGNNLTFNEYEEYESEFYLWATTFDKDELEQDVNNRSFEDIDLLDELNKPIGDNVMYLDRFLSERPSWEVESFAIDKLANPAIWAMSSRAHAELRREWPAHARKKDQIDPHRTDDVQETGRELQAALRRITDTAEKEDSPPVPNRKLFEKLITNYKEKSANLDDALHSVESSYLVKQDWYKARPSQIDFWNGSDQATDYNPDFYFDPKLSVPEGTQPPDNLKSFIPAPYILAEYLGLTDLSPLTVSYSSGWNNLHAVNFGLFYIGEPTVGVTVNFGGRPILVRFVIGSPKKVPATFFSTRMTLSPFVTYPYLGDGAVLPFYWGAELRGAFEAGGSQELSPTPEEQAARGQLLSEVSTRVNQQLQFHRTNTYVEVETDLKGGTLHDEAKILAGAKALLRAFIELGMPLALGADDFLRSPLYGGNQSLVDDEQVKDRYARAALHLPESVHYAVNSYVLLQPVNDRTRFVRVQESPGEILVELTEVHSYFDKRDATFRIVPGLADSNSISFESLDLPAYYLRHQHYRVKLHQLSDDPQFKADATFSVVPGLADPKEVSFKSHNYPDRFLRHRDFHTWVESGSGSPFDQDATFSMQIQNPQVLIKQDADQRVEALGGALTGYLDQIGQGIYAESHILLDRERLRSNAIDTFVVNEGDRATLVEVPEVVGLVRDEAQARLERANLKLGSQEEAASNEVAEGLVMEQKPVAGTKAQRGSAVDVTISTGQGRSCLALLATTVVVPAGMLVARRVLLKR